VGTGGTGGETTEKRGRAIGEGREAAPVHREGKIDVARTPSSTSTSRSRIPSTRPTPPPSRRPILSTAPLPPPPPAVDARTHAQRASGIGIRIGNTNGRKLAGLSDRLCDRLSSVSARPLLDSSRAVALRAARPPRAPRSIALSTRPSFGHPPFPTSRSRQLANIPTRRGGAGVGSGTDGAVSELLGIAA